MSEQYSFVVMGFADCPYYQKALVTAEEIKAANPDNVVWEKRQLTRDDFHVERVKILQKLGHNADYHKTCPLVYTALKNVPKAIIGGASDFENVARYIAEKNPSKQK
jgi:hypothetical protein